MPTLTRLKNTILHEDGTKTFFQVADYVFNSTKFNCGDGYKDGLLHRFKGDEEDVKLLLPLLLRFSKKKELVKLTEITPKSFVFACKQVKAQKMIFKYCRYVRQDSNIEMLKTINLMLQNPKIKPYNALLLGHYIDNYSYYSDGRDIVRLQSQHIFKVDYTFRNWQQFIDRFIFNASDYMINNIFLPKINNVFTYRLDSELRKKVTTLILNRKFEEAQHLLYIPR